MGGYRWSGNTVFTDLEIDSGTLSIDADNNRVGIGTTSPDSTVEIEGSSGDLILEIDNNASNSANFQIQNGAGNARVDLVMNDGSANTTITMKGQKVGIGDTSPSYTLDVGGNAQIVTDLLVGGSVSLQEKAAAISDTAAYGQLWVKTATPNELYFTTDAGDDIQLTTGTAIVGGGMTSFQLEDGAGTEVAVSDAKEVKFVEGDGIDITWTDTSTGSDGDPYDLTFTVTNSANQILHAQVFS